MVIPLAFGLVGKYGRDLKSGVLELTEAKQTFAFADISERPVLSINRGFSAPIKLNTDLDTAALTFLAAHDSDPFNRWQAVNSLATRVLVDSVAAIRRGGAPIEDSSLAAALTAVLANPNLEPAFVAQVVALPSDADIAREIASEVDPDAIHGARRALRRALGGSLAEHLTRTYQSLAAPERYSPDAAAAGRRALKNACLDLMTATEDPSAIARAMDQYRAADNMTDRMAALQSLLQCDVPERSTALDDFYARHADDPLIVDKWLALQAMIPEPATLDRVKALTAHRAFSFANPNRVRALIGSFATGNQTQANRADGLGYDFIVDTVLALDPKNPQLAARLLSALKSWRVLEPGRRALSKAALTRVMKAPSLSRDVSDIAQRALAES
jgi:aminopeptidase N